jgi:hypothetical protein
VCKPQEMSSWPQEMSSWFLSRMGLISWLDLRLRKGIDILIPERAGSPCGTQIIGLAVGTGAKITQLNAPDRPVQAYKQPMGLHWERVQRIHSWMLMIGQYKRTSSRWALLRLMTDTECNHFAMPIIVEWTKMAKCRALWNCESTRSICLIRLSYRIGWTTSEKVNMPWGKLISCRHGSVPKK